MQYRGYDAADPKDIERYAQGLIGKTFNQICEEDEISGVSIIKDSALSYAIEHESKKRKGGLGELLEERYFHYAANSDSRPDFDEAGVELKVSPYKVDAKGKVSAKERLVIGVIDYHQIVNEDFYSSHAWVKGQLMILVYYFYSKEIGNRLDYRIDYARLFSPPDNLGSIWRGMKKGHEKVYSIDKSYIEMVKEESIMRKRGFWMGFLCGVLKSIKKGYR